MCARNEPLDALRSKDYGRDIFRNTMTRTRFKQIMRFIRFDDKTSRTQRRQNDKFCLIREVWDRFVVNCRQSYHPTALLTVDEQLFATKCRCPFTQYMPSKPGKFVIKFWVLADAEKPYVLNMKLYLGKQFDEDRGALQLGEFVILDLIQHYLGKGYNVTTDNFFTSFRLSQKRLQKKTTIVGTVRENRRELPKEFTLRSKKLHDTQQGFHLGVGGGVWGGNALLLSSKVKQTNIVNVLSTMHHSEQDLRQDGSAKQDVIKFYNHTKGGVDRADQMCRLYSVDLYSVDLYSVDLYSVDLYSVDLYSVDLYSVDLYSVDLYSVDLYSVDLYSTKSYSRRWPLQVFCNVLDVAGINAHTI